MNLDGVKEFAKKHWVMLAGGAVGVYVIFHYLGGSSAATTVNADGTTTTPVDNSASQAYALQSQQIAAQSQAASQANEVGQTAAVGTTIGNIGSAISSVINSQSMIPAAAINAASINNQSALVSAAAVAESGNSSLAGILSAVAQNVQASYTPLATLGSSLIGLNDHIGSLGEAAVNAVGTSVSSSAQSAAQSAAASAAANAAATGAIAGAVSSTAKVAMA